MMVHASHFHVRGARQGRLQCSFKDNAIDYDRILDVMRATKYAGYIGRQQVDIARQKGRFLPGEELEMYRFEATILH